MFQKSSLIFLFLFSILMFLQGVSSAQSPVGSAFTYQGRLEQNGSPVNGIVHLRFSLWDAAGTGSPPEGGNQLGARQLLANVPVANGLFVVLLNGGGEFGADAFNGDERWLQIEVCADAGCGTLTILSPRQVLSPAPYALRALVSNDALRLQGQGASDFAPVSHVHDAADITTGLIPNARVSDALSIAAAGSVHGAAIKAGTVAEVRIDAAIARDSEVMPIVLANDGPGSALDADTLDGKDSSAFAAAEHVYDASGNPLWGISAENIFRETGNVGIGTATPQAKLHVLTNGEGGRIQGSTSGSSNLAYMSFVDVLGEHIGYVGDGSSGDKAVYLGAYSGNVHLYTSAGAALTASANGNVGIGNANPLRALQIGSSPNAAFTLEQGGSPNAGFIRFGDQTGWKLRIGRSRESSAGPLNTGTTGTLMTIQDNGNVGIGVGSPQARLDIDGRSAGAGSAISALGGVDGAALVVSTIVGSRNLVEGRQNFIFPAFHITTSGTYVAGSDFAESLPAHGDKSNYEPGDVLVISDQAPGFVEKCTAANDTHVVGVYSTRPGILGAEKNGETRIDMSDVPVAIVGITPTKVSTENGPVQPGDLLTTSSTPGYAMKAAPVPISGIEMYRPGTILGKALQPLKEGTGLIKVLVTLK